MYEGYQEPTKRELNARLAEVYREMAYAHRAGKRDQLRYLKGAAKALKRRIAEAPA